MFCKPERICGSEGAALDDLSPRVGFLIPPQGDRQSLALASALPS